MALLARSLVIILWITITGCSSSSDSSSENNPPPENLEASLNDLGVSTTTSPRVSNEGVPLPDDYAPFGNRITLSTNEAGDVVLGAPDEIAFIGFSLDNENAFLTVIDNIPPFAASVVTPVLPDVLTKSDINQAPWAREQIGFEDDVPALTLRDSAGLDVDGDALQEFVTIRLDGGQLILRVADIDTPAAPAVEQVLSAPTSIAAIGDLRIAGGDFDNDGRDELLIAVSQVAISGQATKSAVMILDDADTNFALIDELTYQSVLPGIDVSVVLKAGNIDYDMASEFIVILNEVTVLSGQNSVDEATTRIFGYDDAARNYTQLFTQRPKVVTADATFLADVADVTIGDIDGDDLNEILVAGISGITLTDNICNQPSGGGPGLMHYLAVVFEFDGIAINQTVSSHSQDQDPIFPSNCVDDGPWKMRFAYVNAVNLDDDKNHEFHINQYVLDGIPAPGEPWSVAAIAQLPRTSLFPNGATGTLDFDRHSAVFTAGDVNGDGRGDILNYRTGVDRVSVYSLTDLDGFYLSGRIMVDISDAVYQTTTGGANPQIILFNGDLVNEGDTQILEFIEHQLDFSEPIVLAALAAPPCIANIDQNHDDCVTSWGKSEAVSLEGEREFSLSAGVSVGVEVEVDAVAAIGGGLSVKVFGFVAKGTLTRETGRLRSESYEVTKSVSFVTGPEEDSVVFTSIPYDLYRYRVVRNTLDEVLNESMFYNVGMPRTPVVRLATTRYYNARTIDSVTKIDDSVFAHRVGDIQSYPTLQDRANILAERRTQVENLRTDCFYCWELNPESIAVVNNPFRSFDPFEALPGLVSEAVGVGQGSGSTEVAVDLNATTSSGRSLEISAEAELELVYNGVIVGFQFGGGASTSTTISRSQGKSYVGTVGSISERDFADNQYTFGMFTYLQGDPDSGQEFEVINYWVE